MLKIKNSILNNKKVFVGMSGGVDSSVAAALLLRDGYDVTGIFIKTWHPDWLPCTWKDERRDAMRVAATLGIPFETFDAEEVYRREVAEYMIAEYKKGRTPNPDVICNKSVKFGAFLDYALSQGADFVATGHYAILEEADGDTVSLIESVDSEKDQTYFLWTLTQRQLRHVLFPIGKYHKGDVRKLAREFDLPTSDKKDSQGVCFLGEIEMKDFLKKYISEKRGDVLDGHGEVIGFHEGSLFYTIGERHGFVVTKKGNNDDPYYVVAKNIDNNTITVSTEKERKTFSIKKARLEDVEWNLTPHEDTTYYARIRYRQTKQQCTLRKTSLSWSVFFEEAQSGLSYGQSLVVYDSNGRCFGGGILSDPVV